MVRIRVPASSANLGPGFDSLGCALGLYLTCDFAVQEGLSISGCPEEHQSENNLIYQSFATAAKRIGSSFPGLSIAIHSQIPIARGLGSSAAAILAGIAGAFLFGGKTLEKEAIFALAAEIEGHPDNVAAACFGGLSAAMLADGKPYQASYKISDGIRFTALIPDFELSTKKARAALPGMISLQDAAHNQAHSLVLIDAFQKGDLSLIKRCMDDRWHEPFRLPLIQDGDNVKSLAEDLGAVCYLSGAGPTLMCLHEGESFSSKIADKLKDHPQWRALPVHVDAEGLQAL